MSGNFSGGGGEQSFWNTAADLTGGFRFSQVTGADTYNDILYLQKNLTRFYTSNAERMRITSTGLVGIGKTPTNKSLELYAASNTGLRIQNSTTGTGSGDGFLLEQGGVDTLLVNYEAGVMKFLTSGAERMRIASAGTVSVGTTSAVASARLAVERIGGAGNEAAIGFTSSGTAKWKIGNIATDSFVVYTPSNQGVYVEAGANSWTGTSDERLKNITGNIENALDAVQTLRAVKFTWIADDENKSQVGLIAQDVQAVLPEVISEDAEGYLGIRYTETIPLLVAAIQEQQVTIEALEARITALEG